MTELRSDPRDDVQEQVVAVTDQPSDPSQSVGINPERKARKEAKKQAANEKKLEQQQNQPASPSSSSKPPHRLDPRSQPVHVQLSKALAYLLRHGAIKEGLAIRQDGYILLEHVLARPRVKSINMSQDGQKPRKPQLEDVKAVVESNEKKRFELLCEDDGSWWVRAVQGHSIKEVTELEHVPLTLDNLELLCLGENQQQPLETEREHRVLVIHGTDAKAWERILHSGGLKPMTRNHIHLAKGKPGQDGVISGMRNSASRLIFVDIKAAIKDGLPFLLSSNGVVLTAGQKASDDQEAVLPLQYFVRVEDKNGQVIWTP